MICKVFPSGPLETNAILLVCEKTGKCAIIDPAYESFEPILDEIETEGLHVSSILLTHSHFDHIADLKAVKDTFESPIYVHPLDKKNVEKPGSDGLPLFFSIPACKPDRFLSDGDTILVGNIVIKVIHTPGHSPGGVCFYMEKEKSLIAGDTLFKNGIGRLDLPTANRDDMIVSLQKLAKLPKDTLVYPGHGETTTIGNELP